MGNNIPAFLLTKESEFVKGHHVKGARFTFLDHTLHKTAKAIQSIYIQADHASQENIICKLNPVIKLLSFIYLIVVISLTHTLISQGVITLAVIVFFIAARINIIQVYKKIMLISFFFGFLVLLPATLNIISPGNIILPVISFHTTRHFWIYEIPQNIGITAEGCNVAVLLFMRVFNSISLALLVVHSTPFSSLLKAFRVFFIPDTFLMIVSLAYKYIFILSVTIEETYLALKSRLTGSLKNRNIRKLVADRLFFMFRRSRTNYELTYFAMLSRGYTGKAKLVMKNRLEIKDIIIFILVLAFGIGVLII